MNLNSTGNLITSQAFAADNANALIKRALGEIHEVYGWQVDDKKPLFSGAYYDSKKVGSYINRAKNKSGKGAVLKLQLRPLEFDEGFIIRYIQKENRSSKIRLPEIILDQAWNEEAGYGFIIFEDLSALPNLWSNGFRVSKKEMDQHKEFLVEFFNRVLPTTPFLDEPQISLREKYIESFEHFYEIASQSDHHHIDDKEAKKFRNLCFQVIEACQFGEMHFTHAHLSGLDIKYDSQKDIFIPLANLYWSYRAQYYEITFPVWVNIMHARDKNFNLDKLLQVVEQWNTLWSVGLYDHDPTDNQQYWFNIFFQAVVTSILDLGAGEWKKGEEKSKKALLEAWKEFVLWLAREKFALA